MGNPVLAVFAFLVMVVFCLVGYGSSVTGIESHTATILERAYKPNTSSIDVGHGPNGPVFTPSGSAEEWIAIVQVGDVIFPVEISQKTWVSAKSGNTIQISRIVRRWFGKGKWQEHD